MSNLGRTSTSEDGDFELVFRPSENPSAQVEGPSPFKEFRVKVGDLLEWFRDLNVDSIELWIEGARKSGNVTELFLSLEGRARAKITLRGQMRSGPSDPLLENLEDSLSPELPGKPIADKKLDPKTRLAEAKSADSAIAALFSPRGGIEEEILTMIGNAVQSIAMAAYAFTNSNIAKALLDAVKRGVKVALVLDQSETKGPQATIHDELEKAGVSIRLISPPGGIMHNKFIVFDGRKVEWGSYNYTERAENTNYENATFSSDNRLAQSYNSDFESIYNQATTEVRGVRRPIRRFMRRVGTPLKRKS